MEQALTATMPYSAYQMVIHSSLPSWQGNPAAAVQWAEEALATLVARAAEPLDLVIQGVADNESEMS